MIPKFRKPKQTYRWAFVEALGRSRSPVRVLWFAVDLTAPKKHILLMKLRLYLLKLFVSVKIFTSRLADCFFADTAVHQRQSLSVIDGFVGEFCIHVNQEFSPSGTIIPGSELDVCVRSGSVRFIGAVLGPAGRGRRNTT